LDRFTRMCWIVFMGIGRVPECFRCLVHLTEESCGLVA
jgi:hypothetical protein